MSVSSRVISVDGRNPANQLRLVVYLIIYSTSFIHPRWSRNSSIRGVCLRRRPCSWRPKDLCWMKLPYKVGPEPIRYHWELQPLYMASKCRFSGDMFVRIYHLYNKWLLKKWYFQTNFRGKFEHILPTWNKQNKCSAIFVSEDSLEPWGNPLTSPSIQRVLIKLYCLLWSLQSFLPVASHGAMQVESR